MSIKGIPNGFEAWSPSRIKTFFWSWDYNASFTGLTGLNLIHVSSIRMRVSHKTQDWRIHWYVFPRKYSDRKIRQALNRAGYVTAGYPCTHSYDCCGHWYPDDLRIIRKGTRALAKVSWQMNV